MHSNLFILMGQSNLFLDYNFLLGTSAAAGRPGFYLFLNKSYNNN